MPQPHRLVQGGGRHTTYHATIATMTFITNTSGTKKPTSILPSSPSRNGLTLRREPNVFPSSAHVGAGRAVAIRAPDPSGVTIARDTAIAIASVRVETFSFFLAFSMYS